MTTLTSWNEAAEAATQDIYRHMQKLESSPSPTIESIRTLFDAFDHEQVFERPASEQKDLVEMPIRFWEDLACFALRWGKENGYEILREELTSTLVRKQRDYGHHNIARYGTTGLVIRVHDKISRLENLTKNKFVPKNESIADTVMDIAGYSAIGIMWMYGQFLLPLETVGA